MIRVGITGGSSRKAGELIRILINHPDIDIRWVQSKRLAGRAITEVHHGLIGETALRFAASVDLGEIDVVFLCHTPGISAKWLETRDIPADLRIIDLSPDLRLAAEHEFVYGLPELNRKALVRGATRAALPHPVAAAILLALLPFAKMQRLASPIMADATVPEFCEEATPDSIVKETAIALSSLDSSFSQPITVKVTPAAHITRELSAQIRFESAEDIGEIFRSFEEFYDDHNFIHLLTFHVADKEVEGTNKCMICIDKEADTVIISVLFDVAVKGEAGTAVHNMNLLFGLHERTGLALKASVL